MNADCLLRDEMVLRGEYDPMPLWLRRRTDLSDSDKLIASWIIGRLRGGATTVEVQAVRVARELAMTERTVRRRLDRMRRAGFLIRYRGQSGWRYGIDREAVTDDLPASPDEPDRLSTPTGQIVRSL